MRCTTPTGTTSVMSSTTGLEFSLDAAPYAVYPAGGYTSVASGPHTLSVKNAAGCIVTVNVPVATAPGGPSSPVTTVTDPTCTTPTGTIAVTSSTTGLEFSLDAAPYAVYPAGGYTSVASGPHTLSVKNAAGCIVTVNVPVATAPGGPSSPVTTVTDPTCTTPTGTIAVTSSTTGLEFSLDAAPYASYPAGGYTSVASGPHTLSVKNAAGCIVTVNVPVATAPGGPSSPVTTVTDPTCTTPTGTIAVTSSTTGLEFSLDAAPYAVYPAGGYTSVASGPHTLSVKNAAGCIVTVNVPVATAPGGPSSPVTTVTDPTCTTPTGTIAVTSSTTGLEFSLDAAPYAVYPAGGYTSVASGPHTLSVKNAAGCIVTVNVPVATAPGGPSSPVTTVTDPTCTTPTGTIAVTSSTTGLEFSLDAAPYAVYPAGGYTSVASGPHTLSVKNAAGCIVTVNVPVATAPGGPSSPVTTVTDPTCTTPTGTIAVTSSTTGLEFSLDAAPYAVYPAGGYTSVASGPHTLSVKNAAGCIVTVNVPVATAPGGPSSPVTTVTDPTCTTPTGTIAVTSSTTGLEFSLDAAPYAVYPAGGYTSVASGPHTLSVKNAAGCIVTVNVPVATAPGGPSSPVTTVTDPTCTTPTGTIAVTSSTTGLEFSLDAAPYAVYPAGGYTSVASGPHTLSVKNAAGCIVTVNVPVATAPGGPSSPVTTVTDPTCTTPTGTIAVTSSTTGLEFSLDAAPYAVYPAGGYTSVASGPHTLSVKNAAGCIVTVNVPVATAPGGPSSPVTTVTDPTCTTPTGTIAVTSSTTGLEFSLDAAPYASYPAGGYTSVASGPHTLSVKNAAGCIVTVNVPVATAPGGPSSPVTTVTDPTCTTPTGTIAVTSSTTGLEFSLDAAPYAVYPAGGYTSVASGPHTLSVKNAAGCIVTVNVPVATAPGGPSSPVTTVTDPTCTTPTGTIAVTSSTTGLEFSLDAAPYAVYPAGGYTSVASGPHTLSVKNAAGCIVTVNVPVATAPGGPSSPVTTVTDPTCTTPTGTIAVTSSTTGLEFSLDAAPYAVYPAGGYTSVASGPHTLSVKNAAGCIVTVNVPVATAPGGPSSPVTTVTDPTCTTPTGTIAVTSSTTGLEFSLDAAPYAVYPAGGYTSVASGPHTLSVKNAAGCIVTVNVPVATAPGGPSSPVTTVTDPTCTTPTGTIAVTSSTTGLEFSLDAAPYASYPAGGYTSVASGPHTLSVKNAAGCIVTVNVPVATAPGGPSSPVTTVTDPTCTTPTGTIAVTSSTTGLEFSLDAAPYAVYPAGGYTSVASGPHTLSVKNAAGCIVTVNVPVATAPGGPSSPVTTVTDPTCTTPTGTIAVTSSTTGLEFSLDAAPYAVYPAGGYTSVASGPHTLSVKNAAGCIVTVNVPVATAPGGPSSPVTTVTDPTCTTPTGTIAVTSSTTGLEFSLDAAPYASYPAGGYTSVASGPHTLSVKNAAGCIVTVNVPVATAPGGPSSPVTTVTDPTCTTPTGTIAVTSSTTGLEFSLDAAPYAAYPAGDYTSVASGPHTLSVKNAAGCTVTVNVPVAAVPGAPSSPVTTVTDPTCTTPTGTIAVTSSTTGLEFSLDAAPYASYPAGGYTSVAPGPHTLSVKNAAGCTVTVNVPVAAVPGAPSSPVTTVTDPTCTTPTGTIAVTSSTTGLEFSLDAAPYGAYPAGGYTSVAPGPHTLSVKNAAGCTVTVNVPVAAVPGAPSSPVTTV